MNKQEKLISLLLGLALVGWFWYTFNQQKKAAAEAARNPQPAAQVQPAQNAAPAPAQAAPQKPVEAPKPKKQKAPEKTVTLANDQVELTLSTRVAVVKSATM